ncbi:MAG: PCP reductase family protein [Thermodesulfobacteriota bacterium]
MNWSAEALELLEKIPVFVRPMAKKKIEKKAEEAGLEEITPEFMQKLRE